MTLIQTLLQKQQQNATGKVRYNLTDCVYATAQIDYGTAKVGLFLGANVMLEYEYAEALEFLTSNLQRAQTELENVEADLSFVRDQIVTCEVLTSRIFNWDVRQRRQRQSNTAASATT
jgi:prefoldin subunit 5